MTRGAEMGVEGIGEGIQGPRRDGIINNKKSYRGCVLARIKKKCDEKAEGSGLEKLMLGSKSDAMIMVRSK